MRVVDRDAPLVGFRNWRIIENQLWSPYIPRSWDQRTMQAECYRGPGALIELNLPADHAPDAAPHPGCRCGIYAYGVRPTRFSSVDHRGVTGIVSVWGRLEDHTDGVRAEHVRIEALAAAPHWSERQRWAGLELAERLDVDLVDDAELEGVAARYGRPLQDELGSAPVGAARASIMSRGLAPLRRLVQATRR